MIGPKPVNNDFAQNGNTAQARQQDAVYNINMLRGKYGTGVQVPWLAPTTQQIGLYNSGPGTLTFQDILVTGTQPQVHYDPSYYQMGAEAAYGESIRLANVAMWGLEAGIHTWTGGTIQTDGLYICASTLHAVTIIGMLGLNNFGLYGNTFDGIISSGGIITGSTGVISCNGRYGIDIFAAASCSIWYLNAWVNAVYDVIVYANSTAAFKYAGVISNTSPPANVEGNQGSLVII
jgi:hypothetical protein